MLSLWSIYPLQTFQLAQDGRQCDISMVCHTDWIVQSMIFLFISFRDFLCSNVQLPLSHIKLAGLQHPLNHQWVPWLLIYRILWDFGMGFCMPDLLVLEMCILSPITGYLWHNDRETQCTLMLLYQNWEKDFHTSPGCALSWVDTQFTGASFTLSCFALGNNSHI